jgi:hypothetical protein
MGEGRAIGSRCPALISLPARRYRPPCCHRLDLFEDRSYVWFVPNLSHHVGRSGGLAGPAVRGGVLGHVEGSPYWRVTAATTRAQWARVIASYASLTRRYCANVTSFDQIRVVHELADVLRTAAGDREPESPRPPARAGPVSAEAGQLRARSRPGVLGLVHDSGRGGRIRRARAVGISGRRQSHRGGRTDGLVLCDQQRRYEQFLQAPPRPAIALPLEISGRCCFVVAASACADRAQCGAVGSEPGIWLSYRDARPVGPRLDRYHPGRHPRR